MPTTHLLQCPTDTKKGGITHKNEKEIFIKVNKNHKILPDPTDLRENGWIPSPKNVLTFLCDDNSQTQTAHTERIINGKMFGNSSK